LAAARLFFWPARALVPMTWCWPPGPRCVSR